MREKIKTIVRALKDHTDTSYVIERKRLKTGLETVIWSDNTVTVSEWTVKDMSRYE